MELMLASLATHNESSDFPSGKKQQFHCCNPKNFTQPSEGHCLFYDLDRNGFFGSLR